MIELVVADAPGVVCLQELPAWALSRLEAWSGMRTFGTIARRPLVRGPVPAWVTRVHQGRIRSAFVGQANAVLVAPSLAATDLGRERISLPGREPRFVQAVRVAEHVVVGNLHASSLARSPEVVRDEIERARVFAERAAGPEDAVVLAGDFNVRDLAIPGYSRASGEIDDVLVRGAPTSRALVWPLERRRRAGVVLSDHAPVEVVVG